MLAGDGMRCLGRAASRRTQHTVQGCAQSTTSSAIHPHMCSTQLLRTHPRTHPQPFDVVALGSGVQLLRDGLLSAHGSWRGGGGVPPAALLAATRVNCRSGHVSAVGAGLSRLLFLRCLPPSMWLLSVPHCLAVDFTLNGASVAEMEATRIRRAKMPAVRTVNVGGLLVR